MVTCKRQHVIQLVPPDGEWGWMVLLGEVINNIVIISMLSVFGLLYGDTLEAMGHKTQGAVLVLNTVYFISIFTGPIVGAIIKLTSPRAVAVTGACISTVGIFLSGYSTNIWHLVITYGVMLGLGMDLIFISSFVAINSYFSLKKNRAVGLSMVGTSVGQTLMPHIVRYLLENYGFHDTCMILSSLSFHGVAGCMLLQPVEKHMKQVERKDMTTKVPMEYGNQQNDKDADEISKLIEPNITMENKSLPDDKLIINEYASKVYGPETNNNPNKITTVNHVPDKKSSTLWSLYDLFGVALLCNIRFINILMGLALSTTSILNCSMLYPFFLEKEALLSKQQTAYCMSAVAIGDVLGCFIVPFFQDKYKIKARWILVMTCFWLIITRQILAYQSNPEILLAMSVFYGFGKSMIFVQKNLVISENCELAEVPAAVGLGKFTTGIMSLPLGYFLGWIRDYTESYFVCLTAQNILLVILLLTWIPEMLYIYVKENKQQNNTLTKCDYKLADVGGLADVES